MNARQRRKMRRGGDPRGYLCVISGFMRMVDDEDPEVRLETGQLYENTLTGKLRVTLGGAWFDATDELDAKRRVQNFLRNQK